MDQCYDPLQGPLFITGLQALVRLLLLQKQLDRKAGLNTGAFVSGYRGSPLGELDRELWRAGSFLKEADIYFQPGVNEDLAATAVWGSQQVNLYPGGRFDGVFGFWYGKGPGLDRSGDVLKHGNAAGTAPHGGVLVTVGDDHVCSSSTLAHQSEYGFMDAMIPVLNPADVQDLLTAGLMGYALSRFSGCWVGLKVVKEIADLSQTINLDLDEFQVVLPEFNMPDGGLHIRWPDHPLDQEYRLQRHKISAALAFARANQLNHSVIGSRHSRLGILTTGKAHLDVLQALQDLGINEERAAEIGICVFKVGMSWPLEPHDIREFAEGLEEVLVVEEKRGIVESQIKEQLYNWKGAQRPLIIGKFDEYGEWMLPSTADLTPARVARVIARRLGRFYSSSDMEQHLRFLEEKEQKTDALDKDFDRSPYFCSGCPHNTSTRLPEGSRAIAGIGCHYMVNWMDRSTGMFTQMGGEGASWIGQAPFTETEHVFQNLGDGTYTHSGLLAIRAAVASEVNMTYKLLFNDAVAMTGGQPVEGGFSVVQVAQQLASEGVKRIALLSDHPHKYGDQKGLPVGVTVHHRDELDRVQRSLRDHTGVSALIYDQTCAAELRRLRKRGEAETPDRRVVINDLVCEGCGDCSVQSNCLSVIPLETEFGRKRAISQSSCNLDFSCLKGFCPSFVTLEGAVTRPPMPLAPAMMSPLPEPTPASIKYNYNILLAGIGGTGVVTASSLLGMAAHLEGKAVRQMDQTGLAQKFGAVMSHVRIAPTNEGLYTAHIPAGQVDLLLGCDLMVAASKESLVKLTAERTAVVVNAHEEMPASFIKDRDLAFPSHTMLAALKGSARAEAFFKLDATRLTNSLLGDTIATNLFMLGVAYQHGLLPVSVAALVRALELYGVNVDQNKLALNWGRYAAHEPEEVGRLAGPVPQRDKFSQTLEDSIAFREAFLVDYQNGAYAKRYMDVIQCAQEAEQRVRQTSTALTSAIARNYFKLLAYKDEYEVARLYVQPEFFDRLRREFNGDYKIKFHFSPPLIARTDIATGRPRKYEFGGWVMFLLRLLARLRFLRGTPFDLFGYFKERRLERRLIENYECLVKKFINELSEERLDLAVQLAELPDQIRGFGPIKKAAAEQAQLKERELLEKWARDMESVTASPATAA